MDISSKYLEQLNRVQRWYQRFSTINEERQHNLISDNYQDEVYAFFLNCYHLKDWIINDKSTGIDKDTMESFINNNQDLKLCADICNSIKHLKLKRPRSSQNPEFGKRKFYVKLGGLETTISVKYTIDTSTGPIDAFELATRCQQAWEGFLQSNINV
jgi:hypothetical protein